MTFIASYLMIFIMAIVLLIVFADRILPLTPFSARDESGTVGTGATVTKSG